MRGAITACKFVAGGTTLIDLMKLNVETPAGPHRHQSLRSTRSKARADGGVKIGAMVRNSDLAHHELIAKKYPVLSQALAFRCLAAAAQYGDHWRQPAAAHALLLLPRHRLPACNKRIPARAARPSTVTTAFTPSWGPASTALPRILRIWLWP